MVPLAACWAAAACLYAGNLRLPLLGDDFGFAHHAFTQDLREWLPTTGGAPFFRPLSRQVYFETMGALFGASPLPYHVVNAGLTLGIASLLFAFAFLEAGPVAGTTAALAFLAQHGLSVATGWASCAQDLLALAATLCALHAARRARYRRAALYVALAVLCKETGAIAAGLVVAAAWQWADVHAPAADWRARARHAALAWPSVAVVTVWALLYALVFRHLPGTPPHAATVDVSWTPDAIARGFAFAGASLINAENGLGARVAGLDALRMIGATICAAFGLAAAGQLSRGWRQIVGARPHPLRDGDEGLVALGLWWIVCALPFVLAVGHRPNAYHSLPLACGFAILLAGLFARRRFAASVVIGALIATGPLADARPVRGAPDPQLVTSLAHLRGWSGFVGGLHDSLAAHHPHVAPGSTFVLEGVPEHAADALHGADAARLWYGDPSLRLAMQHQEEVPAAGDVYVVAWDAAARGRWREWSPARVAMRQRTLAAARSAAWAQALAPGDSLSLAAQWTRRTDAISAVACLRFAREAERRGEREIADSARAVAVALDSTVARRVGDVLPSR